MSEIPAGLGENISATISFVLQSVYPTPSQGPASVLFSLLKEKQKLLFPQLIPYLTELNSETQ